MKNGLITKTIFIFAVESTFMGRHMVCIFLILCCFDTPSKAQQKINFIETNVAYCKPSGFFGNNIKTSKIGFEMAFLRQMEVDKPLFWGISIYYAQLGCASATLDELLDFNLVTFNYSTSSNLLGFNGKVRFYPKIPAGNLEMYVEAQLGYKYLFTNTTKNLTSNNSNSSTHLEEGSLSLTYGVSSGINFPLNNQLYINIRANYLPGLSVAYFNLMPENIIRESSLDNFVLKHSTTDLVRFDLGITYKFFNLINTEH